MMLDVVECSEVAAGSARPNKGGPALSLQILDVSAYDLTYLFRWLDANSASNSLGGRSGDLWECAFNFVMC